MMFLIDPKLRRKRIDRETTESLDGWQCLPGTTDPGSLLKAVLEIGRRRTYGLRCSKWKPIAQSLTDKVLGLHVQAVNGFVWGCNERMGLDARSSQDREPLVAMVIGDAQHTFGSPYDSESLRLLQDRMAVMFGVQGLAWLFSERSFDEKESERESSELSADYQYGKLAAQINAYDKALEEKTFALSLYEVARGNELAAMRAFIPSSHLLPWWLDGTFEALCLASEYCRSSWDQLATTIQIHGPGKLFRQALLEALHGPGAEVQSIASRPGKQKPLIHRYAWRLPGHGTPNARVELLATWTGSRVPSLEFRLDRESEHDLGPAVVGSMMILNGLPVRWLWTATKGLFASAKPSEFPTTGDLLLADCRTFQILEPAAPQPGWLSQFEPHG